MAKKITTKSYENSAMDKKTDKVGAKKMGVPVKKYEGTKENKKEDEKNIKKMGMVITAKKNKPKVISAMPR